MKFPKPIRFKFSALRVLIDQLHIIPFIAIFFIAGSNSFSQNCSIDAGSDQLICEDSLLILEGSIDGEFTDTGSITWLQTDGPATTIVEPNNLVTEVEGIEGGNQYTFRLSATCDDFSEVFDEIEVTVVAGSMADAGADQQLCGLTSTTLDGNLPTSPSIGKWTQLSGPGVLIFDDDSQYNTIVSGLQPGSPSVYEIEWQHFIEVAGCESTDIMTIEVWAQPSSAFAGSDQVLCNATTAILGANIPAVGTGLWTFVSGPTSPSILIPGSPNSIVSNLQPGTYSFAWTISNGEICDSNTDNVSITIRPPIQLSGIVNATLCPGEQHEITVTAAGGSGLYNYQWQYFDTDEWDNTGDNNNSFTTPEVFEPGIYEYRVVVSDQVAATNGGCQTISAIAEITITDPPTIDSQPQALTYVCSGENTALEVSASTAEPVDINYQWQVSLSDNPYNWTDITGANNPSFTTPNLTETRYYRVLIDLTGSDCPAVVSDIAVVEINTLDAGTIGSAQSICAGNTPDELTSLVDASGTGSITYQWQLSTNGTNFTDIDGANQASYSPEAITVNTWYQRLAVSTIDGQSCQSGSNSLKITVIPAPFVNDPADLEFCSGEATGNIVFSGGPADVVFTWQNNNTAIGLGATGIGNIASFTATNTTTAPITATITVTPEVSGEETECNGVPQSFTITVYPTPIITSASSATICSGTSVNYAITANVPGTTFIWTATLQSGTASGFANGNGNLISQTLNNSSNTQAVVRYNITPTSPEPGSCQGESFQLNVTINPTAQVNQPTNRVYCAGTMAPAVVFSTTITDGETTYTWANSNTAIGLGASGSGNLPSFTATNNTQTPITSTITVTPQYLNGGITCSGSPVTFTITVNPEGQVNDPPNQTVCAGDDVTVNFATSNTGGTTTYSWTNSNTAIGLSASGNGNISFESSGSLTAPVSALITVTPTFSNGGVSCTGDAETFTITVMPMGQVTQPANISVCSDSNTTGIAFQTVNTGGVTTYTWTNNNTSIGLAASGTGNIQPFYTIITGTVPVIATITVTPTFTSGTFSCQGTSKQFTITVNPRPVITSASTLTICDQSSVNYTPTANIAGTTFIWTASVISGSATGFSATGSGPITDIITNTQTSNAASVIRYIITPNGTSGCSGSTFNLDVTVRKCADIVVTKTDGSTQYTPGSTVVYTVVVLNNGPSGASGVTISDSAPTGTSISSWSAVFTGGATGSTNGSGNINEVINLPKNGKATYTLNLAVPVSFSGNLTNTASVTLPAVITDPVPGNNSATDTNTQISTANLRLVKTGTPNPVVAGGNITYQISLTNDGPGNAQNVQVNDQLPASVSLVSATPSQGTWASPLWNVGTLASGATVTLTIAGIVNSATTASISNTATATSTTFDPNTQNNTDTEVTLVVTSADLSITNTATPATVVAGETLTYTIVVSNTGPSNALNVAVNNLLPNAVTFVSATPSTGTFSAGSWSIGTLGAGNNATLTLVTRVKSNITASVVNIATVTSSTPDPNPNNNSSSQTTAVTTRADLIITKTADANSLLAGETVTYTILVRNNGPSDALTVRVQDIIPSELNILEVLVGTGFWAAPNWNIGTLAKDQEFTMTIEAIVGPGTAGTITNTATVTSTTSDPTTSNNTSSHNLSVATSAVLSISKTGPAEIIAGERITYALLVNNLGPSNAINVVVTDELPTGLSNPQYSIDGGNNWFTWNGTYNIAILDAGSSFDIRLRATTLPSLNNGQVITNTASASSPTAAEPAEDSHSTTVRNSADVSIVKTRNDGLVVAGANIIYTITVSNAGPSNARNVTVTDILPGNLTFVSAIPQQGTWASPTWTVGTIAAGASTSMALTATVNADVDDGTLIVNEVSLTTTTPDPNAANNQDELSVSVNTEANLAITKSVNNSTPDVGSNVVFTINVTNQGPSVASGVYVTDELPAGFTYLSHSGGNYNAATDTWLIGDMSISGTSSLQITARVNQTGSYTNTANVVGNENDPNTANNTASVTVTPRPVADMAVVKTANVSYQSVGNDVIFTITATNNGPSNATGVQVQDNLGAGFTFKSASTVAGTFNNTTGIWTINNINAASSVVLTITATVNPTGSFVNTTTVSATQFDPVSGNNSSSVTISVIQANDDNFTSTPINGYTGGTSGNVLVNDLLQGNPVNPALVNVSITNNSGLTNLSINSTGNLIVPPSSPAGSYNVTYQICEKSIPLNCDNAAISFTVNPPVINAVNDNFASTPVIGRVGGVAGNVLSNDLLNNNPIVASQVAITITQNGGLSGATISQGGFLNVPAATPAQTYQVNYQICETINPGNCDVAQSTVLVTAAEIQAVNDDFTSNPVDGTIGGIAGNVLNNDLLNNLPVVANDVNITILDNGDIPGISINAQGQLIIPPGIGANQYSISYRICEKLNPTNCDDATVNFLVSSASILAVDDSFGPVNGFIGSNNTGNILSNDVLNGIPVSISQVDLSIISIHEVLTLDLETGIIGVLPLTPEGIYELEYQICEKLNPENCDMAITTVVVIPATIDAFDDNFGPVSGLPGFPNVGNILANDLFNGTEAQLELVTITVSSIDDQLTLDTNTGEVSILPGTIEGNYFIEYQICENLNPTNCDNALVTVIISSALLIANDDIFEPVNGFTGDAEVGNVLGNDFLEGSPASLTDLYLSLISSDSEKILLDTLTGIVGVLPAIAAGTYELEYKLCLKLNPANCDTATVSITITAPQIIANDDIPDPFDGITGSAGEINIFSNDLINGQTVEASWVNLTIISSDFPERINIDINSGDLTVAPFTPGGTFTLVYQICEILNPDNCDQASVIVTVTPFTDLSIEKTANIALPEAGQEVTFTLVAANLGPVDATDVVVIDQLKTGFTYVSDNSEGAWDPESGIWNIGELALDSSISIEILVSMNEMGNFTNTASVSASEPDPDLTNNISQINLAPDSDTDLMIVKSVSNSTPNILDEVTFTLTATNMGPGLANNVMVADPLPNGIEYISHSASENYLPSTGEWEIETMESGQTRILEITARIIAGGTITNVATITGLENDPNPLNNTSLATIFAVNLADLTITKAVDIQEVYPGDDVVFTLSVTNQGPGAAGNVEVLDLLATGFSYLSDTGAGAYDPSTGLWIVGSLEKDETRNLEISATVNNSGVYTNTASVSSDEIDPDESNNIDSVQLTVVLEADLGVIKTSDQASARVGDMVEFYIDVTNYGPGDASEVQVIDQLPTGFQYISHIGIGMFDPITGQWLLGDLANQSTISLSISATVNEQGDYTNVASVTGNESDPLPDNNTSSLTIEVDRELVYSEGFSPNGDGFNDYFVIVGLERYPNNTLVVLNRWGNKVYESSPYNNDWDGTNSFGVAVGGRDLPEGTYFYILEVHEPGIKPIKGFIYLKR